MPHTAEEKQDVENNKNEAAKKQGQMTLTISSLSSYDKRFYDIKGEASIHAHLKGRN